MEGEATLSKAEKKDLFLRRMGFHRGVDHFATPEKAFEKRPMMWIWDVIFWAFLIGLAIYMNWSLGISEQWAHRVSWRMVDRILKGLFNPNWDYFWGSGRETDLGTFTWESSVIYECLQTFGIAFLGTFISAIVAIPFGLLASNKLFGRWSWVSTIFLILIRTFPELLLGYILIKLCSFTAFTGILAIGLHSVGMIGKLYAEQVDDISMEPLEALSACGASSYQRLHLGVMPQCTAGFVSTALYRFDINIRTATIMGIVCGDKCGIGHYINSFSGNYHWNELGSALIGVIIMVIIVDIVSSVLRKKLV